MKILRKLLGLLGALVVLSGCLTAGACNNDFSSVDNREDGILLFDLLPNGWRGPASTIATYELDAQHNKESISRENDGEEYWFIISKKTPDGGRHEYFDEDRLEPCYYYKDFEGKQKIVGCLSVPGVYEVTVEIPATHSYLKPYTAVLTVTIREIDN